MTDPQTVYENAGRFKALFAGLDTAFGYNSNPPRWVKRPLRIEDVSEHLLGRNAGIGIGPLRPDNTVMFAAIDLDEPDFDAAREMQEWIPGVSWIERSKSGNAHVWVFFKAPCEAWVAMGVLREATRAAGKDHVEVFPKNWDFGRVKLGNYINLPFHGDDRPILGSSIDGDAEPPALVQFLDEAFELANDPEDWKKQARWFMLHDPRLLPERTNAFGEQEHLHMCAQHVIDNMEENPVLHGHMNLTFFMLAKCLTNCRQYDSGETLEIMQAVRDASPDAGWMPDSELMRILSNAERGQYTSTGCDDPVVLPYTHPECPIAHP